MKWNKENKIKLYRLLWTKNDEFVPKKLGRWSSKDIVLIEKRWNAFLKAFSIEKIHDLEWEKVPMMRYGRSNKLECGAPVEGFPEFCFVRGDSIILDDPWEGGGLALKIPKDIAEKFLVLGIP